MAVLHAFLVALKLKLVGQGLNDDANSERNHPFQRPSWFPDGHQEYYLALGPKWRCIGEVDSMSTGMALVMLPSLSTWTSV